MNHRRLGKSGLSVSEIGFGAWGLGGDSYGAISTEDAISLVRHARERGVTFFDTADIYGDGRSEELLGAALAGDRDAVVLATKVGALPHAHGPMRHDFTPVRVETCLEASLRRLNTDHVDLYQMHSPNLAAVGDETFACLDRLKRSGKARLIGLSARSPRDVLEGLARFDFDCVQLNLSLVDQRAVDDEALAAAAARGVGVIVRTPLCHGFLSGRQAGRDFGSGDHRSRWPREQRMRWNGAARLFEPIATARGCSAAQLALRYCLDAEGVSTVIPGFMRPSQVDENVLASEQGHLAREERSLIRDIYKSNVFFDEAARPA